MRTRSCSQLRTVLTVTRSMTATSTTESAAFKRTSRNSSALQCGCIIGIVHRLFHSAPALKRHHRTVPRLLFTVPTLTRHVDAKTQVRTAPARHHTSPPITRTTQSHPRQLLHYVIHERDSKASVPAREQTSDQQPAQTARQQHDPARKTQSRPRQATASASPRFAP